MKYRDDLTAEQVREVLSYDSLTGILIWLPRAWDLRFTVRYAGTRAGKVLPSGARIVYVHGKPYYAHRLAWLYHYGEWPPGDLDHRNVRPDDNWITNLRPATKSGNGANTHAYKNSKTGVKGVSFCKRNGRFHAQIRSRGKSIHIGYFRVVEEAGAAYAAAASKYHGEFARAA